eukprot:TRINITY_DN37926_c0_g1_i1.p1 TRINITY_DN37926_c0_g1~~TRINITY_DN37926_c0_g1_i1.p1  ORF type:complete len:410 (+),score=55.71 TRINITY_DN37926_c0_g1_i1:56-1285(+)
MYEGSVKRSRSATPERRQSRTSYKHVKREISSERQWQWNWGCSSDEEMQEGSLKRQRSPERKEDEGIRERKRLNQQYSLCVIGCGVWVTVDIGTEDTVLALKDKIDKRAGTFKEAFHLYHKGLLLPTDALISATTLTDGTTVDFVSRPTPQFSFTTRKINFFCDALCISMTETHIYAAGPTGVLTAFSMATTQITSTPLPHPVLSLTTHGNVLYASCGIHGVLCVSLTPEGGMLYKGRVAGLGGYTVNDVSVDGHYAAVVAGSDVLSCRMGSPTSFEVLHVVYAGMECSRVVAGGGVVYVIGSKADPEPSSFFTLPRGVLVIMDRSLSVLSTVSCDCCSGLALQSPSLYVSSSSDDSHLKLFDVMHPTAPKARHVIEAPLDLVLYDVAVQGPVAGLALGKQVVVVRDRW